MTAESLNLEVLERQLNGSMTLVEVTCQLSGQHELDRILQTVTASVCEALACERASLFLYDEVRHELFTRVATELEIEEIRTSVERGITGWVARRRKIANIPDPQIDARWNSAIDRKTGFHTRNILAAPVVSARDSRLLGVLQILNKRDGGFDSFDERLLQAFAAHAATALERSRLLDELKSAQELRLSLELARQIQTGFLPTRLDEIPSYEVAAWWEPAEAVGGDYYDVFRMPDGRTGLVIGDVSGHGASASLIMASFRAMVHVLKRTHADPARILSLVSETITPDLQNGRFISCLMGMLDSASHEIRFANAGHGPVLHYCRKSDQVEVLQPTCLPIGFDPGHAAANGKPIPMQPGDLFVMATDGSIELTNEEGVIYGRGRLEELIREHHARTAAELRDLIRADIVGYHPHEMPPDDVTLVLLKRTAS